MTSRTLIYAAAICGAALASSVVVGPALAQQQVSPPEFEIDVGGWSGGAVGTPDTGQFSHCQIVRQYGNGLTLLLLLSPRYELNIGLVNPAWNLEPEEPATDPEQAAAPQEEEEESPPTALVSVDAVYEREFPVQPVAESVLMVTTGVDDQLIELLMRGNNVDVATDQGNYRFALTGTFNSITALRGCIDTARRLAAEARAAGPQQAAPLTGQALANILRDAGLEGAAIAPQPADSSPLGLSFAWSLGPLTGGVHQSPRPSQQVEIDKFTELYIDQFGATCTEEFQRSEQEAEVIREQYAMKLASLQCGDDTSGLYVSLFIALDDNFYTAFFHQGPVADRAQVNDATARIRELVRQQAGS